MSIEAMKQALEVLEDFVDDPRAQKEIDEASTALRQAIEQAEKQEPVAQVYRHGKSSNGTPWHGIHWFNENVNMPDGTLLYTTPQPQREWERPWVSLTDEDIEKLAVENGQATFLNDDEETGIIWFDGDATPFAQAIEAKLKEKNT
jgi:hypothetical protein